MNLGKRRKKSDLPGHWLAWVGLGGAALYLIGPAIRFRAAKWFAGELQRAADEGPPPAPPPGPVEGLDDALRARGVRR